MADTAARRREEALAFGTFRLFINQRVLLDGLAPVRLGGRAMDLLIALVERAGETVGKNELIHRAWATAVVEENTLRVHIAAIRKLLGDGRSGERYIVNVAGRGYSFVAPLTRVDLRESSQTLSSAESSLPRLTTRVLGRDDAIRGVTRLLGKHRLVTVVGPGGIGKTTVALAAADRIAADSDRVARFVDLSALTDPGLVPMMLALAVGVITPTDDPVESLTLHLKGTRTLLLLDNCEHVVAQVARVAEHILRAASDVAILCTSRERLSAEGEATYVLGPLSCPPTRESVSVATALHFSAVQLFAERAFGAQESFEVSERNVDAVVDICRRLDCSPLAIELVAARLGALGVEMIASSLAQNLLAVSKGRRSGVGRHRSLSAALGWSFTLLTPTDQAVLRRIATFSGSFPAESAAVVCAGTDLSPAEVPNSLLSLVAKSLLVADTNDSTLRFRLLHVTRAFALERLVEAGEEAVFRRAHAEHHRDLLGGASDWDSSSGEAWHERHRDALDDVRAALNWAFGPSGDVDLGAALFVAALPFGLQLSLHEFAARARRTLEVLRRRAVPDLLAELRMRTALAMLQFQAGGDEAALNAVITTIVALAERIAVPRHRITAYALRAIIALENVDYVGAVQGFEALQGVAREADDVFAALVADRVGAQVFNWAGDQVKARVRAERVLRHATGAVPLAYVQASVDRQVSMRVVLARAAWLGGRTDDARTIALEAVALASEDVPLSLCHALGFAACPIALWRGDFSEANELIERLLERSRRHDFKRWYRLGLCFQQSMPASTPELIDLAPMGLLQRDLLGTVNPRWADAATLTRAQLGLAGWCNAEFLRVAAERLLQPGEGDAEAAAEARFRAALQYAKDQGAIAWELRTATSLGRLYLARGRRDLAREALEPVCDGVRQGLDTLDICRARAVLLDT